MATPREARSSEGRVVAPANERSSEATEASSSDEEDLGTTDGSDKGRGKWNKDDVGIADGPHADPYHISPQDKDKGGYLMPLAVSEPTFKEEW